MSESQRTIFHTVCGMAVLCLLASLSQILIKLSLERTAFPREFSFEAVKAFAVSCVNIHFAGGVGLFALASLGYMALLAKTPLSILYPMVSLAYVWGVLLSWIFLGERMSLSKIVGVILIIAGTYILTGCSAGDL